jgi:hypothetical protein
MRAVFQLVIAGHLIVGYGNAMVYYVATSGDDSYAGSPDAPFRTLMRAVAAVVPGDTVIVRDGVYGHENTVTAGDDPNAGEASPVVLESSGSAEAWIIIQAENKWGAILDCEMLCDAYINLANASYIVIQGFVITRGYKEGIHSNNAAHHISLLGNRIENIARRYSSASYGLDGMYTNPNCHDFTIEGNLFHDIGRTNASQLDHGLYLRGSNLTITNNIFYNIPHGWSIVAADGLNNVVIANNTFAFPNENNRGGHIVLWNIQSNIVIQNNIFYKPANYAVARFQSTLRGCTMDHNVVFGAIGMMADQRGCELGVNQIGVDPLFVNPTTAPYNFRLQPGSPALGAGACWSSFKHRCGAYPMEHP